MPRLENPLHTPVKVTKTHHKSSRILGNEEIGSGKG